MVLLNAYTLNLKHQRRFGLYYPVFSSTIYVLLCFKIPFTTDRNTEYSGM